MHLKPKDLINADETRLLEHLPAVPSGKTIVDVFADVLRYLFDCTKTFIEQHHPAGDLLWTSVKSNTEFVLSHPNGWKGAQQTQMRRAAIQAGLVPDPETGARRIHFEIGRAHV